MHQTLGEALPAEMARVRDEVMPAYAACGDVGAFALAQMRVELDAAAKALSERDMATAVRVYESLKGWHV